MRRYKILSNVRRRRGFKIRPDLLEVDWYSEHRLTIEVSTAGRIRRGSRWSARKAVVVGVVSSLLGTAAWWTLTHFDVAWQWLVAMVA